MKLTYALLLITSLSSLARSQTSGNWQQLFPAASPPARNGNVVSYDPVRGQVVMFGGQDTAGVFLQDTWIFDGMNWINRTPKGASPVGRLAAAMAFDQKTGLLVLFGGAAFDGTTLNDTWTWDGAVWTQQHPATQPAARFGHAMAYDAIRGRVLLFGGNVDNAISSGMGDSWTWDGTNWTLAGQSGPSPRSNAGLAYCSASGEIVLFGGVGVDGNVLGDTWVWDGFQWTQRLEQPAPSPRSGPSMSSGLVVLFGGAAQGRSLNDTWTWDGNNWTLQTVTAQPAPRLAGRVLAFDAASGSVVLFDGRNFADTWTFMGQFPSVNGSLKYTISPAVYSRVTGNYIVQVTAANTGATVLRGPFLLVLNNLLAANAVNANGRYQGMPYVVATDAQGQPVQSLDPGQSFTSAVELPLLRVTPITYGR